MRSINVTKSKYNRRDSFFVIAVVTMINKYQQNMKKSTETKLKQTNKFNNNFLFDYIYILDKLDK